MTKFVYSDPLLTKIDQIKFTNAPKVTQLKAWIAANQKDDAVVVPPPPPPPPPGLTDIDGGKNYYGQFMFPLSDDPSYFPIGVWYEAVLDQSMIDLDKACGLNLYVYLTPDSNMDLINKAGMKALLQADWMSKNVAANPAFAGWVIADEPDMQQANPDGAVIARADLAKKIAALPADGRARYINFGKGVTVWNLPDDQAKYLNDFSHLQSVDNYWFTDNDLMTQWQGGGDPSSSASTSFTLPGLQS